MRKAKQKHYARFAVLAYQPGRLALYDKIYAYRFDS
jgi:hypothetical protein